MRPSVTTAALSAVILSILPTARADEVPEPESRTVLVPPTPPQAEEKPAPAPRTEQLAPREGRTELGFQLRAGAADTDRALFGSSLVGNSGPFTFGLSGDVTFDVGGRRHHEDDDWDDDDHHDRSCVEHGGRCRNQLDLALSGFGGLRYKTNPIFGGSRLRLELVGEAGWQVVYVDERLEGGTGDHWSDASRAFPFAGLRGGVGLTFLRNAYVGVGAYARQGLAGKVCVDTDGGCTRVGGFTGGVYLYGGGEWGIGH